MYSSSLLLLPPHLLLSPSSQLRPHPLPSQPAPAASTANTPRNPLPLPLPKAFVPPRLRVEPVQVVGGRDDSRVDALRAEKDFLKLGCAGGFEAVRW